MRDRAISLLGGLLSLLAILVLLVPTPAQHEKVSVPTSADTGDAGLLGLKRWIENAGIPTHSLRQRYQALTEGDLPESGNLLITNLPHSYASRAEERRALTGWLMDGNSMLIVLNSRPDQVWNSEQTEQANELLRELAFHIDTEFDSDTAETSSSEASTARLIPALDHPLLSGVDEVRAWQAKLPTNTQLIPDDEMRLALTVLRHDAQPALSQAIAGAGHVWLVTHGGSFANGLLNEADNAQLFANIAEHALNPGGHVVFDDFHQGLSDLYDPAAFFRDSRLHNTVLFIGAFWLLYLVGYSNRLAPLRPSHSRPMATELAEASAALYSRRISDRDLARGLLRHFYDDIRRRYRLAADTDAARTMLERDARISPADLERLRQYEASPGRGPRGLIGLSQLLSKLRKQLS